MSDFKKTKIKYPNNLRLDGTKKGPGFAQIRKPNQPTTMTEYSIGSPGGKGGETFRPSITPNMHPAEANYMQMTGKVSETQKRTSLTHAKKRIAKGLSPFKKGVYKK